MINTIQFNNKEYHRIAVKRDVEAVAQTRYGFFYAHWSVLIDGISYLFFSPKPINGVYTLEGTNMTIPESAITTTVYEGMEVTINMSNSVLTTTGTLHINSSYFNYGCSKSTVDQSECKLKWPSVNYNLDRLVREEDIIKPDTVKLYFDENHIDVECFTKFDIPDYSIVTGTYTGYISRSINDSLNANVLRSRNSQSYITCHIGDTIKIISKSKALKNVAIRSYVELEGDYPIIAPVDENGNINVINLQNDGSFDYTITSDCFVTFDIAAANYTLYGAILEDTEYCDHCGVQVNGTDFIIAGLTDEAKRFIQENSKVNINTSLSIYTVEAYIKERDGVFAGEPKYVIVDNNHNPIYDTAGLPVYVDSEEYDGLSLLTNLQGQIILGTNSTPLDVQDWYNLIEVINLTTNTKVTVNYNNDGSQGGNRSAYFNMPASDCLLTVTTNIITGGDTVTISPRYSLTIDVDENSKNIFPISITTGNTTTEYNSSTTIRNIENNYFSATWNKIDSKLYHILYKDNHNTIFFDLALKTTSYSNSLMGNRTLSIRLIDPDIIYRNTTEISTITTGKEYEENNNIISNNNVIMALNDYPRRTYYATTESPIKTSNTHFNNLQELKKVIFNNTDTTFTVDADAFYNCLKLESVTINGTENIKVKDRAFYNNIMLTEFNDLNKITELGHSCFYGSALNEYKSNVKLKNIPELAFSKSSLSTVNLAGTPIDPAELTSIDNSAFSNCLKLNTVHLPYALSKLGQGVFENTAIPCVHTIPAYTEETVFSPYGVVFNVYDDYTNLLTILPKNTFKYCAKLVEVHLPASINHIEKGAFHECNNLTHFASPGLKTLELGVFSNTWIEKKHTYNSDKMTAYSTYGDGSGKIYKYKDTEGIYFDYCRGVLAHPNDHVVCIKPNPNKNNYILYKRPCPFSGSTNVYFHAPIFGIADYGFAYKDMINWLNPYSVDFNAYAPHGRLEYIGKYAFKDSGVKFVQFAGNSLHTLGEGAFYNCRALRNVFGLEESLVTKIEPYTFYNCGGDRYGIGWYDGSTNEPSLDFYIPQNTTSIGDYAFYNCRQLMGIKNHALCPIKKIGKYAFAQCFRNTHNIWDAVIWTVVFAIKTAATIYCSWYICGGTSWGAFDGGVSVIKVWLSPHLTGNAVGAGWLTSDILHAAVGAAGIADFVTGASVGWGDNSEPYPSSLTYAIQSCITAANTRSNLMFPYLEELGEGAFSKCNYLGRVMLGDAVTHIPDYAFYGCTRLTGVNFCKNVNWYDENGISLFYVDSNIKTIGKFSFSQCKNLHDISIDAMLKSATCIKEGAFKDSVVKYTSYLNETEGSVESALTIPDTLTTLEAGSLGFNRKNKFVFISDNPRTKQYSSNTFDGGTDSKIFLIVPEGSKNDYKLIFPNVPSDNICEVSKSDSLWTLHKLAGYTIPWLAD